MLIVLGFHDPITTSDLGFHDSTILDLFFFSDNVYLPVSLNKYLLFEASAVLS